MLHSLVSETIQVPSVTQPRPRIPTPTPLTPVVCAALTYHLRGSTRIPLPALPSDRHPRAHVMCSTPLPPSRPQYRSIRSSSGSCCDGSSSLACPAPPPCSPSSPPPPRRPLAAWSGEVDDLVCWLERVTTISIALFTLCLRYAPNAYYVLTLSRSVCVPGVQPDRVVRQLPDGAHGGPGPAAAHGRGQVGHS